MHSQQETRASTSLSSGALLWYALRTKSNCEKQVCLALKGKGFETFLPEYRVRRQSFGRVVTVDTALFPGYLFCRFDTGNRIPVISTPGLVCVVGFGSEFTPIPDHQIHAISTMLASGLRVESCGYLQEGQKVRLKKAPFAGVEGILVEKKTDCKFVVSIPLLQRSVAVDVDPAWIVPV